jgi:hypothetical protein
MGWLWPGYWLIPVGLGLLLGGLMFGYNNTRSSMIGPKRKIQPRWIVVQVIGGVFILAGIVLIIATSNPHD